MYRDTQNNILFKDEVFVIQGTVFDVYKEMGCGFLESVYQECMEIELRNRRIPHTSQKELILRYKGQTLKQVYKPDFICFNSIIVELKAVTTIGNDHKAQLFNYLRASGLRLGLLVNFGHYPKVQIERIIL